MNVKIYAYLGALIAVLVAGRWSYVAIYDAGFNAAIVKQEALIQDARDQASQAAAVKWQKLVDQAEGHIIEVEVIREKIIEVAVEIPKVVEKIVEVNPDCNDLGPDFLRLLNAQVNAGASRENNNSDITANPD